VYVNKTTAVHGKQIEDTKGRKSKDRQCNGQKNKNKQWSIKHHTEN